MGKQEPTTLEEEFQRNKDMKKEEFEAMKNWCEKQSYLPRFSDELLAQFFHSCYYNMELTKTTIDSYFTTRTHVPEFFTNRDPFKTDMKRGKPVVGYFMLPGQTPEGSKVLFVKVIQSDPSDFNFNEACKNFLMTSDLDLYLNGTSDGYLIIIDMSPVQLGHLTRLNPLTMKKILYYLQDAFPVRLKGLHFINCVSFMDKILALMKPFLKKDLLEMIYLHTNGMESVYKAVPKTMLPSDYNGDAPSFDKLHEDFIKLRQQYKEFYQQEEKLRVDEKKRPGKAKNAGDLYGIEGSFKKLDLD